MILIIPNSLNFKGFTVLGNRWKLFAFQCWKSTGTTRCNRINGFEIYRRWRYPYFTHLFRFTLERKFDNLPFLEINLYGDKMLPDHHGLLYLG